MMRFRREAAADVAAVEKAVTDTAVQNLFNPSLENEQSLLLSVGYIIVQIVTPEGSRGPSIYPLKQLFRQRLQCTQVIREAPMFVCDGRVRFEKRRYRRDTRDRYMNHKVPSLQAQPR